MEAKAARPGYDSLFVHGSHALNSGVYLLIAAGIITHLAHLEPGDSETLHVREIRDVGDLFQHVDGAGIRRV